MSIFKENEKLDGECPSCKSPITFTFKQVKQEATITCPSCKESIHLKDESFSKGIESAEKTINDFMKKFK